MIARIPNPAQLPVPEIMAQVVSEGQYPIKRAKRGSICLKSNDKRVLEFQFNPTELNFSKRNRWEMLQYTGQTGVDSIWMGGESKTIQFSLMIDKTTCSIYDYVFGGKRTMDDVNNSPGGDLGEIASREFPRGTLDIVEMLESFQYPIGEFDTQWFKNGMVKLTQQFLSPPDLVFTFGQFYLICKLVELSVKHILFNKELIPVRTEAEITLTIKENESEIVDTNTMVSLSFNEPNLRDSVNHSDINF